MAKLLASCWVLFTLANLFISPSRSAGEAYYDVVNFGAKGDGRTDSTLGFSRAWMAACNSARPATVYVPRGSFLLKSVAFNGPCKNNRMTFQIDGAQLVAPPNYRALGNSGFWILFYKVTGLSVRGGTIDARGSGFWKCRRSGSNCPAGTRSMTFLSCNNVVISGLTSLNSQTIHVAIGQSTNVRIQNAKIIAPSRSPNTDGINVHSSTGVTISDTVIRTGDDCVSVGPGSKNLWMERIACGPGHGISIGSLGNSVNEEGVENVTVSGAVFTKTQNGVRIKSWARPSNGYARNILFRNIVMRNVGNPILIDQQYCPDNRCPGQGSSSRGVRVSEVTYSNIKGISAAEAAVRLECSRSRPCNGIRLEDIKLSYPNRAAQASCAYAAGTTRGLVIPKSCLWK